MTLAVDQPQYRHEWVRRSEVVTPSGTRATVRPLGAAGVGLISALLGAWGALCVFIGPYFGYRPTSATTWQWTTNNWLLHLLPGAVAVAAGLMIMTLSPVRRAGGIRSGLGLAALLLAASGAWFVIGPAWWPTFQSSPAYATGTGAWTSFWNQLGANLGPGVLLAFFGGMALKAGIARPKVAVGEPAVAGEPGVVRDGTRGDERAMNGDRMATTSPGAAETRGGMVGRDERAGYGERAPQDERASYGEGAGPYGERAGRDEGIAPYGEAPHDDTTATAAAPGEADRGRAEDPGGRPAPGTNRQE
jgi:hypothetical protein